MIIELNHTEIEDALRMYIDQGGIDLSEKNVEVQINAVRNPSGFVARIAIDEPAGAGSRKVQVTDVSDIADDQPTSDGERVAELKPEPQPEKKPAPQKRQRKPRSKNKAQPQELKPDETALDVGQANAYKVGALFGDDDLSQSNSGATPLHKKTASLFDD